MNMIQIENTGAGKIRFAIKDPSLVEILLVDGKMFAHSEPLPVKSTANPTPAFTGKAKTDEKELDFLKETKSS